MDSSNRPRGRHTIHRGSSLFAIASLVVGLAVSGTFGVSAAAEAQTISGCQIIENPTELEHTECPGALLVNTSLAGLNLDYANFAGADLSGTYLSSASLFNADLRDVNLTDAWLTGANLSKAILTRATLGNTNAVAANFEGADLSEAVIQGSARLQDANLRSVDLDGAIFDPTAYLGGVDLRGASLVATQLPSYLSGSSLEGVDLSKATLADDTLIAGGNLIDADLSGLALNGLTLDGADALRLNMAGVTLAPGSTFSARGVNFTEANLSGVDFRSADEVRLDGSPLAFADLRNSHVILAGGGYFADANLAGASLYGRADGSIFDRANMRGVVAVHGLAPDLPLTFGGASFHGTDLTDADFDNTVLSAAGFVDANLTRARIQSAGALGLAGTLFLRADLTDATLPPAKNLNGWDPQKWLYGFFLHDSQLQGTNLVNADTTVLSSFPGPTVVDYGVPAAFANPDGELPYGAEYDGGYWWGARYTCDRPSGSTFPLGETTVSCDLTIDHSITDGGPWQPPILFNPAAGQTGNDELGVTVSTIGEPQVEPIRQGSTLADLREEWGSLRSHENYRHGSLFFPSNTGIYTLSSATFTVTVNAAPTLDGSARSAIAGTPFEDELDVQGYPQPLVELLAGELPSGLTLAGDGSITGTPEAGTGGVWPLTVSATNTFGDAQLELTLTVVDPSVQLQSGVPLREGALIDVTGNGYTPGGDVEVWVHSSPNHAATVVADEDGSVRAAVPAPASGTHHLELVDVTTGETAVSAPFEVVSPGLAATGADSLARVIALALLLLITGGICTFAVRERAQMPAPAMTGSTDRSDINPERNTR